MFKNLLSAVGWGDLPASFGFHVGEKVELPYSWRWELRKGTKKADGSTVSIFFLAKKDLESQAVASAKNAIQMAKMLRHTYVVKTHDSLEVEGGFYIVTEEVTPLLCLQATDAEDRKPAVWGLFEAFEALGFVHQSGFAHGLMGPASIFVTSKGEYRLGAFDLCRKGADAQALIGQRRNCCPHILGWPDPPPYLLDATAPTIGIDLWGAATLMAFVFGTAKTGSRGTEFRLDMTKAAQDIPPELRKPFQDLAKPGPLRGRNPILDVTQLPFFQENPTIRVMGFLGSLHIRSSEEKDTFFEHLLGFLDDVSIPIQTRQILPHLLEAQRFPGQEAAQVLPAILKIGTRLSPEEFKEKVAPLVAQLFAAPDRAIRYRLLSSLGEMIDHLDDDMINDKIFPECMNGFSDSNGPIREATVKSLIFFVPRLKAKIVEGKVIKLLVKVMQDSESSIRTNAVICCGRISGQLSPAVASQSLAQVLTAGLKDPFAPCRKAALQTLAACSTVFSDEELATKMLPQICCRLVDQDPNVSETAFSVLHTLQEEVRRLLEEKRALAVTNGVGGKVDSATAAAGPTSDGREQGGWSWSFSTVGSVVGDKIMGSINRAKSEAETATSPTPAPAPTQSSSTSYAATPARPAPPAPQQAVSVSSAPARVPGAGMALSSGARTSSKTQSDGWGDDSDDFGAPGAAPAAAWGDDGEFWDEFGDAPKQAAPAAGTLPKKDSGLSIKSAPATSKPATAAAAAPKAKPVAIATPLKLGEDDEDFWKEFDM